MVVFRKLESIPRARFSSISNYCTYGVPGSSIYMVDSMMYVIV